MFPPTVTASDVLVKFQETDQSFANPGQGWMTMRRMPDGPGRFPYSVAYFRLNWDWHEANWIGSKKYAKVPGFAEQWQRAPVVFEWFEPYDYLVQRGWCFDRALAFMAANHVTLINDNLTTWLPGDRTIAATLRLPADLPPGRYTLGVGLVDPTSKQPAIHLAIDAPHTDRLYRLSSIQVPSR